MNLSEAINILKQFKADIKKYKTDISERGYLRVYVGKEDVEAIDTVVEYVGKYQPIEDIISEVLAKVCNVKTETIEKFNENVATTITLQQAIEAMNIYGKQQYNQCLKDLIADGLLPDKEKNLKKYIK